MQRRTGVSVVLVTHDMREAVRLSDHLMILRNGEVAQSAATQEVVTQPADEYVQTLVQKQL